MCIETDQSVVTEAWKSLTDKVQEARSNARLKELSFEGDLSFQKHPKTNKESLFFFFRRLIRILSTGCRCKWVENAGNCPRGSDLPA